MEKITRTILCDSCGKEIKEGGHFVFSRLYMQTLAWGGGSIGGDEDHREIYADLCESCCCRIERYLSDSMNIRMQICKPYTHHIVKA